MINEDQIRVMIKFMERHGDLRRSGDVRQRERIKKKWLELVAILNRIGEKKSLRQWSKVWSDTKYNTIKKYKLSTRGGPKLTENENTIIRVIRNQPGRNSQRIAQTNDHSPVNLELSVPSINNICNSCENPIKEELSRDQDLPSHDLPEPLPEQVFYVLPRTDQRRDSLLSSASSSKSFAAERDSDNARARRSSTDSIEKLTEIADKFYELERERDRLAHEREMARIKQHSELLSVMSRMVNVVELLAPSLKRFMDRSVNEGG
ncbi:uncharacterized protein LOC106136483 [Amyelois transitella]|uniref:uncharacterized protein LOC106136483 n=1 Tax=Amyelois transitella TaxID=680683 RepID=UPI00067A77A7|nr:uncharacterized protein LOC106136483 [Amyelois transitella]